MTKREYLINCIKKDGCITSYDMNHQLKGYINIFHKESDYKKAKNSFLYQVRKLVKEQILFPAYRCGLGIGSKLECMGSTQQIFWNVRPWVDLNAL